MTHDDDVSNARAAHIARRLGEAFGFLHDALDDPATIGLIPDGSTLVCRSVVIRGCAFRLTAFRPNAAPGPWSSRVTSGSEQQRSSPSETAPETPHSGQDPSVPSDAGAIGRLIQTGPTAEAALDAIEFALRAHLATNDRTRSQHRAIP